jgi:hypothetical protein
MVRMVGHRPQNMSFCSLIRDNSGTDDIREEALGKCIAW